MAVAKKPKYEPDAMYKVKVAKVVTLGPDTLRPRSDCTIKGRVLNKMKAADIQSAAPVSELK